MFFPQEISKGFCESSSEDIFGRRISQEYDRNQNAKCRESLRVLIRQNFDYVRSKKLLRNRKKSAKAACVM